jgi:hypothetical protein
VVPYPSQLLDLSHTGTCGPGLTLSTITCLYEHSKVLRHRHRPLWAFPDTHAQGHDGINSNQKNTSSHNVIFLMNIYKYILLSQFETFAYILHFLHNIYHSQYLYIACVYIYCIYILVCYILVGKFFNLYIYHIYCYLFSCFFFLYKIYTTHNIYILHFCIYIAYILLLYI